MDQRDEFNIVFKEVKFTIWDSVSFYTREFFNTFSVMGNFIRNICRYRKVLAYDYNWDSCYLFVIMSKKLRLMYKQLSKDNRVLLEHHKSHNDYLRDLQYAIHCCDRVANEDFDKMEKYYAEGIDIRDLYVDRLFFYIRRSYAKWWS